MALVKNSGGRSDALSITSITTSETSVAAVLRGTTGLVGPIAITGIIVTNDVGSGGTFTIRGYSDASKTIQLFEWSADLTTGADDWNSTQFPQPRPLGRAEGLNVTAEVASGSGHGVDVWIEYIDMDVVV